MENALLLQHTVVTMMRCTRLRKLLVGQPALILWLTPRVLSLTARTVLAGTTRCYMTMAHVLMLWNVAVWSTRSHMRYTIDITQYMQAYSYSCFKIYNNILNTVASMKKFSDFSSRKVNYVICSTGRLYASINLSVT